MKFLHFIIENETKNQIESIYSNNVNPKFSLNCFTQIDGGKKFTYKIWNRDTDEIITIK